MSPVGTNRPVNLCKVLFAVAILLGWLSWADPIAAAADAFRVVGVASNPSGYGYWTAEYGGSVSNYGSARELGDARLALRAPIVGIAASRTGDGYWLAGADGGVFTFGDAGFLGAGMLKSYDPVVGIVRTPTGQGYWLVHESTASDKFGDSPFDVVIVP